MPTAIVLAAVIVGGSLAYGLLGGRLTSAIGRHHIVSANENVVWVINTETGLLRICGYSTHTSTAEKQFVSRCFLVDNPDGMVLTDEQVGITPPQNKLNGK